MLLSKGGGRKDEGWGPDDFLPFTPCVTRIQVYSQCKVSQLLSMTPSCLQNQHHLSDSYTLPSPAEAWGITLVIFGTQFLCAIRKHFSPQWCWYLLNANFLVPATSIHCPRSPFYSFWGGVVCLFVSLCSPGCPGTNSVDKAGLELKNPAASASRVLG